MTPARLRRRTIGALRHRAGLTSGDLSARLDIDIRTVERLEAGQTPLGVDRLLKLSEILDCDPLSLLAALLLDAPELALGSTPGVGPLVLLTSLAGQPPERIAGQLKSWKTGLAPDEA